MPNELKDQLRRILETLVIESPTAFTFGGKRIHADGSTPYQLPQVPAIRNPLIAALQMQLYQHCYCKPFASAITEAPPVGDGGKDLSAELAEANAGQERWESGWRIVQVLSSGQLAAQRNGLSRLLWPGEYPRRRRGGHAAPRRLRQRVLQAAIDHHAARVLLCLR